MPDVSPGVKMLYLIPERRRLVGPAPVDVPVENKETFNLLFIKR